jgi:hypothetical protein
LNGKGVSVNELEVRRTVELYRSMIVSETNHRRRTMLVELLGQEERKLDAIDMMFRSDQDR